MHGPLAVVGYAIARSVLWRLAKISLLRDALQDTLQETLQRRL
jgi:hypothetical protein